MSANNCLSIFCGEGVEEEIKEGSFVEAHDWNDDTEIQANMQQRQKIQQVEQQVTLMNKNRPPSSDDLPALEQHTKSYDMMRGTIYNPSVDVDMDFVPPNFPKSEEQREFLHRVLQDNFLFGELDDSDTWQLIDAMQQEQVEKESIIIKQGDTGDFFYVVEKGQVTFRLDAAGDVGECGAGGSFGELALLYDCPRAASCIAASDSVVLWKVDQKTFRRMLAFQAHKHNSQMKDQLKKIALFKGLGPADLNRFANSLTPVHWKKDTRIVEKGEEGNVFYIVQEGSVKIHDIGLGDSTFEDQEVGPGGWFGERALLTGEPRAANVTAASDVTTMAMDRETFEKTIGPLKSLMEREMRCQFLRGLPIFAKAKVSDKELAQLVDLMKEETYPSGHKLVESGKPYQLVLWVIRHGRLLVQSSKSDKIYNLQSGDHFGDKSVRGDPNHISSHTAVCEEELTTWTLARQDIESVLGDIHRLGQTSEFLKTHSTRSKSMVLSDLVKHRVLGHGAFGKVWLVSNGSSDASYALKQINKRRIVESQQLDSVVREKEFLSLLQHPFILHLEASFQDDANVYLLLPVVPGGELFSLLHKNKCKGRGLANDSAAFYAAGVIEALGHFHQRSIAYRDLKLENVLIDEKGYCKIVDLGFAKVVEEKTYTLVGTPEYLAPEIIMSKGHDKSVDYWAFGVLIYELLAGRSPFYMRGSSQIDMFKRIVMGHYQPPAFMSVAAVDLIQKLLQRRVSRRLGNLANGYIDIRRAPWFEASSIDFPSIRRMETEAPWQPQIKNSLDSSNFDDFSSVEKEVENTPPLSAKEQEAFVGF